MKATRLPILGICVISTLGVGCAAVQKREPPGRGAESVSPAAVSTNLLTSVPGYTGFTFAVQVSIGDSPQQTGYTTVSEIEPGSPAAKAGFAAGDVLIEANGQDLLKNPRALSPSLVGVKYVVRVRRGGEERELTLVPIRFAANKPNGTEDRP